MIRAAALACGLLAAGATGAQTVLRMEGTDGAMAVAAAQVAKAEVAPLPAPTVHVTLAPELAPTLTDLTERHIGRPLRVSVCGRLVSEPVVRERIASGRLALSVGSPLAAERMVRALDGTLGCLEAGALGFGD